MRTVLVVALGALALAGCVHPGGPHRAPAYGYSGYGYSPGYAAAPRRAVVYLPVHVQPAYRQVEHRQHWRERGHHRDRWRERQRDRERRDWWWRD